MNFIKIPLLICEIKMTFRRSFAVFSRFDKRFHLKYGCFFLQLNVLFYFLSVKVDNQFTFKLLL